jgi:hypothetical protein
MALSKHTSADPHVVGANFDTFIGNARLAGEFPNDLAHHLEDLKRLDVGGSSSISWL